LRFAKDILNKLGTRGRLDWADAEEAFKIVNEGQTRRFAPKQYVMIAVLWFKQQMFRLFTA